MPEIDYWWTTLSKQTSNQLSCFAQIRYILGDVRDILVLQINMRELREHTTRPVGQQCMSPEFVSVPEIYITQMSY